MSGPDRTHAYGQENALSWLDGFGQWLSARSVRRLLPTLDGKRVADVGCGYDARIARALAGRARTLHLLDVALSPDLARASGTELHVGPLPGTLAELQDESIDVVLLISVLEHLTEPRVALAHAHRILARGGACVVNVPSWRGKTFLELSAFRLGLSPREEMDDHKMYYDPRDLWPLVVQAGFRPSAMRVFRHKLGLNTLAVAFK